VACSLAPFNDATAYIKIASDIAAKYTVDVTQNQNSLEPDQELVPHNPVVIAVSKGGNQILAVTGDTP
jgi:hypothetical protein